MEKKIIFLELPVKIIEQIDYQNTTENRSHFITNLLQKQFESPISTMNMTPGTPSMNIEEVDNKPGEINLVNNKGESLGKFNINTTDGFIDLVKTIREISDNPYVQIKAKNYL